MINELGPNDWRFKAIKQAYEGGNVKKVGAVVCQNPNAHWNQVEEALLDADYGDMVQFADELNLEQNNEEKMLNEIKRMQKLAGLLKENDEMGASSGPSVESILQDFQSVGINAGDQIAWEKAYGMDLTQHIGSASELAAEIAEEVDDLEYEFFSSPEDLEYQEFEAGTETDGYTPVAAVQIEDSISYLIGKK